MNAPKRHPWGKGIHPSGLAMWVRDTQLGGSRFQNVSVSEKSRFAGVSVRSRNGYQRIPVVLVHHGGFSLPVVRVVLDDAKGVYPEVLNAEFASQVDSLGKCAWEATLLDSE
jgi:hypothetical protein